MNWAVVSEKGDRVIGRINSRNLFKTEPNQKFGWASNMRKDNWAILVLRRINTKEQETLPNM
jgi:hypothetical protein